MPTIETITVRFPKRSYQLTKKAAVERGLTVQAFLEAAAIAHADGTRPSAQREDFTARLDRLSVEQRERLSNLLDLMLTSGPHDQVKVNLHLEGLWRMTHPRSKTSKDGHGDKD
jgi:uncharacterized protein (DUF1778 family)